MRVVCQTLDRRLQRPVRLLQVLDPVAARPLRPGRPQRPVKLRGVRGMIRQSWQMHRPAVTRNRLTQIRVPIPRLPQPIRRRPVPVHRQRRPQVAVVNQRRRLVEPCQRRLGMRSAIGPPIRRNQPSRIVQQRGPQRRRPGPSRRLDSRVKRANCVANADPIARPGRPTQKTRRCGQQPCLRGMPLRAPQRARRLRVRALRRLATSRPPLRHPQPLARPRKQVGKLLRRKHQQRPRRRLRRLVQVVRWSVALQQQPRQVVIRQRELHRMRLNTQPRHRPPQLPNRPLRVLLPQRRSPPSPLQRPLNRFSYSPDPPNRQITPSVYEPHPVAQPHLHLYSTSVQ